jgi:biotin-(acetyl-CoA carboxylase) ligase
MTGRRVEVHEGAETFDGRVRGLDDEGHLMIEDSRRTLHRVLTGEIRMLD